MTGAPTVNMALTGGQACDQNGQNCVERGHRPHHAGQPAGADHKGPERPEPLQASIPSLTSAWPTTSTSAQVANHQRKRAASSQEAALLACCVLQFFGFLGQQFPNNLRRGLERRIDLRLVFAAGLGDLGLAAA